MLIFVMKEKLQKYSPSPLSTNFPLLSWTTNEGAEKGYIGEPLVTFKILYTVTVEQPMTKISISMSLTYDFGE